MGGIYNSQYTGVGIIILGFLMLWFNISILGYAAIVLGIIACSYNIWKSPINGVYLTIFFLPLTKTLNLPLVGTKIALPEILFIITFIFFLFKKGFNFQKFKQDYYIITLMAFLFFSFISVFNAISLKNWFLEVASYVFLTIFFLSIIYILDNSKKIDVAVKTLILSLSIVIFIGFVGYLLYAFNIQNNPFIEGFRINSTFKAINQLSISLLVGFFLLINQGEYHLQRKNWAKSLLFALICLLGIFIFLASGSRMAIIVLVPTILLYLVLQFFSIKQIPFIGIISLIMIIVLIFSPIQIPKGTSFDRVTDSVKTLPAFPQKIDSSEIFVGDSENLDNQENNVFLKFVKQSDTPRYYQLLAFRGMFRDHPFLGVGSGNFVNQMPNYVNYSKSWEMHNTFLGILAEIGLLGFISFVTFLFFVYLNAIKKYFKLTNLKYKGYISMILLGLFSNMLYTTVQFGLRNRHM